jgi:hypothetical protein
MPRSTRLPLLITILALAGGCTPGPAGTFEQGVEHQPGPGWIRVVTQPASADIDLTFVLIAGGEASSIVNTVPAGDVFAIDLIALPGAHGISLNGTTCENRFPVEEDRQTEVVVRITADGCATAVKGIRDAEEMRNP